MNKNEKLLMLATTIRVFILLHNRMVLITTMAEKTQTAIIMIE